jgi:hypothetical protein
MFLILISLLLPPAFAEKLPVTIEAAQAMKVTLGECQAEWRTILPLPAKSHDLGSGVRLWLVPCAHWAVNDNWSAYLTIPASSAPGGEVVRALNFVNYSLNQKLMAEAVIHNPVFREADRSLEQTYYPQSGGACISVSRYIWHPGHQSFILEKILKRDECRDFSAPLERIYPKP